MTAEDVLANAANLIEKHGWCQFLFEDRNGALCIMGALKKTVLGTMCLTQYFDAVSAIRSELGVTLADLDGIPNWNDMPGRTGIEVISTLRNAKRHLKPTQENV